MITTINEFRNINESIRLMPYPINLNNIIKYDDQIEFIKLYNKSRNIKNDLFDFDNTFVYDIDSGENISGQHKNGALNNMTNGELATLLDNKYGLKPINEFKNNMSNKKGNGDNGNWNIGDCTYYIGNGGEAANPYSEILSIDDNGYRKLANGKLIHPDNEHYISINASEANENSTIATKTGGYIYGYHPIKNIIKILNDKGIYAVESGDDELYYKINNLEQQNIVKSVMLAHDWTQDEIDTIFKNAIITNESLNENKSSTVDKITIEIAFDTIDEKNDFIEYMESDYYIHSDLNLKLKLDTQLNNLETAIEEIQNYTNTVTISW